MLKQAIHGNNRHVNIDMDHGNDYLLQYLHVEVQESQLKCLRIAGCASLAGILSESRTK